MKMDTLMLKFPYLSEQIFEKLNNESLFKSREVARSWQNLINGRNYPWLFIVNIPTLQKRNAYLHLATETGQIEAFNTSFNEEKDKNIKNKEGETSFHLACKNGRFKIVKLLLENACLGINNWSINLNAKTKSDQTAFILACQKGHTDIVKLLMENAAAFRLDLNAKDESDMTSFHHVCIQGHTDLVNIFVENAATFGIDLNTKDVEGFTGLHFACIEGHSDVVKIIIKNAAKLSFDLNAKDNYGWTGLYYACFEDNLDVMKILIENATRIDLNAKDISSAFNILCIKGRSNLIKIFRENTGQNVIQPKCSNPR